MNPPSALHGAMSRDRKPFTYTPGGLDLSEIKSERMAKRLMRNAMNQGVPEVPMQPAHPHSNTSAPVALPNFNCLPVQVFPTFNLPANPKTLLRTRSDPRETPIQRVVPSFVNNNRIDNYDILKNNNTPPCSQVNNNRPMSMYEYNTPPAPVPVNTYSLPRANYGSDGYTAPVLPEISYEAEYFRAPPKDFSATEQLPKLDLSEEKDKHNYSVETNLDLTIKPLAEVTIPIVSPTSVVSIPAEEIVGTENDQREVKVVKKQVKKENKVEEQNGNQNENGSTEAEMTVKLPTKKSAAKTETNVEVVKKVLPDGSIEEVKTTTTKTTIDGRTEIRTKTETTIIPKEVDSEEEVVEEEEEEEVQEEQVEEPETTTVTTTTTVAPKENGQESKIVKTEERSESTTTTTKKVVLVEEAPKEEQSVEVVIQQQEPEEEEEEEVEEEVVEEAEPVTVVLKKQPTPEPEPVVESKPAELEEEEVEEEAEEEVEEEPKVEQKSVEQEVEIEEKAVEEEVVEVKKEEVETPAPKEDEEEVEEEEEEYEEAEEETKTEVKQETEVKETKEEIEEEQEETVEKEVKEEEKAAPEAPSEPKETPKEPEEKVIKVEVVQTEETKEEKPEPKVQYNIPIREPSIPLDKVEDVEIKPIGSSPIISKTHTENTEIIRSTIDPSSGLSTQTEYNKIENIVTVNRTTKFLDHNYETLTQQGIPTVKTYFPPPSIDRISTSPMPSRPYQPVYPPEPTTERRHSLLLERLSTERQIPSDIYQYGNQTSDQSQYPSEPRAEVLTVSNVKPSSITSDQQWYQQSSQHNLIYNNVSSTPTPTAQPWAQPKSQPQPQPTYQQQYQPSPQQYQPPPQQYQPSPTPQPQYQAPSTPQPQYKPSPTPQPSYQHSFSEPVPERAPSSYSTYTPTPTWASNTDSQQNTTQTNQYSYLNKETDSYKSTQQYSSSYVPPPWEQDSSYTSVNNTSQVYYQPAPLPQTQSFTPTPAPAPGWKPAPASKFSKNAPISYIPPAPNQSFVRSASVSEPPRTPGRKTYYSEYERRYITVPESTYIPTETKYQPQPDPSPQYYYDNNEPSEEVEPQWRRELREFTEKTSKTTTTTEQTSVQPPWETDAKYVKNPSVTYTPTPTWSQTLRPRSWRERSFESEYVSQEWPKTTNTLGRGRPLSTLGKSVDAAVPESRTRGVSVDRYNPNSYHSPAEHPPVQAHTLTTPAPHAGYHNPNVPAYHARASAEPREQPTAYQSRLYRESRASPLQSRSFKYLQWITGTEN